MVILHSVAITRNMGYFGSFLFRFLALHFLLNSLQKNAAFQSDALSSNHFHIVEVSSLLPASTCSPSSATASSEEEEDSLKLVHNYGPCSFRKDGKTNAPSMLEILERDHKRVSFIASRQRYGKNNIQVRGDSNNGQYIVNVGLGTPKKELTLMIDTGSSLIWTQCRPCKLGNLQGCYKQRHPIFDPLKSSTYSNITCPSHTCSLTNITSGFSSACVSSTCVYFTGYVDRSFAGGFLAKERLSVGSKTFNGIIFGCNEGNIDNSLPGIDGLMGLGRDFLSFVEQTAKTYKRVFSYCLPSTSEIGFLKFGEAKLVSKSLKYTKLGADYAVQLVGIKLGKTTIPIAVKKGGASIDSGTTISRIPPKAYIALRKAYRKAMSHYQLAEPYSVLDTCYHIGRHQKLKIPKMSFLFADGLVLDIPPGGIAVPLNSTVVCLPFAVYPGGDNMVLFGSTQQTTLEIVYDVAGGKLGFGYGGCK